MQLEELLGITFGGVIEECYHKGDISSNWKAGGIVGETSSLTKTAIINCYNIGNVTCPSGIGGSAAGIVSYPGSRCYNCYSIGAPKDGIIIGGSYGDTRAIHCFGRRGDKDSFEDDVVLTDPQILVIIGGKDVQKCEVLFDTQLKEKAFVTELNKLILFDEEEGKIAEPTVQNVWKMDETKINNGYPIFTWQK